MGHSEDTPGRAPTRRQFLKLSGLAAAAVATGAAELPLLHFRRVAQAATAEPDPSQTSPKLGRWEDLLRQRWTWDSVAKGSHGWANCRSACAWDLYVKDGIVVREEQSATYQASEAGVPDFNPRGCQKGACYTEVMYGPSRLTVPMKRVGERGGGQWQRISWEQAIGEIADKMVRIAEEHGPETIYQDLGPNFDQGATTVGRFKFQMKAGGLFADNWAEIGDLNTGATLTLGFAHVGGTSDEWFLSDFPVVWMMNPSVTQISDAHFLYEGRYNGAKLTVIDPHYSATVLRADTWLPIRTGTDAALGLATARHIWESGNLDLAYVREQTDLPLLVRRDTDRFLRESDLIEEGRDDVLYMWNPKTGRPEQAPGSQGADSGRLTVEGFEPPIEGSFSVELKDGRKVIATPVGTILKKHLEPWTFEATSQVTGLGPQLIEEFADGFARSKRPMIFSSWGSNRFLHSDLMNRTKLLCLSLKGALGRKGSGYHSTGFFDLAGFGSQLQRSRTGLLGRLELILGMLSPQEAFEAIVDVIKERKSQEQVIAETADKGQDRFVCATNVSTLDYHYQGTKEDLDREMDSLFPRPLGDYDREATEKGWQPVLPRKGQPRIFLTGGSNLLRRSNHTARMLDTFWPGIELVVAIDQKQCFTGMHADYLLPAAGWYEKSGIKYALTYVPYLHYCDAAVKPIGESKDEWEIYWLLSKEIEEIAKRRNTPVFDACGKFEVDWKELHQEYSCQGAWGPKDAEVVTQAIIDDSPSALGMTVEGLKTTGIEKFRNTGLNISPTFLYNPDWQGEGVLSPLTHFVEHKWRWPTLTGRQQYYIDHPWFLEAGEALPTHKESPKAGGDYPFQLVSCHCRWSIHSTWRDTTTLLRLQRGEPMLYLNPDEATALNLGDGDWAQIYNRLGQIRMRIKYSHMVRPGVAFYFHAWEAVQFPDHKSYKWLIPGLMKPLHMAGGEGHLRFGINHFEPGSFVQDTRVGIRPWKEASEQTA